MRLSSLAGIAIVPCLCLGLFGCGSDSSGGGGGGGGGSGSPGGLDGVWEITSNVRGGPAQMTISGGVLTGYMVDKREGQPNFEGLSDCVATKYRTEFKGTVSGNSVTASRTNITELAGNGCGTLQHEKNVTRTFTGGRPATAPNWDGAWIVNGEGEAWNANVNGLNVTAQSTSTPKRPKQETLTIAVAGDMMTITPSSDDALTFAAHRIR